MSQASGPFGGEPFAQPQQGYSQEFSQGYSQGYDQQPFASPQSPALQSPAMQYASPAAQASRTDVKPAVAALTLCFHTAEVHCNATPHYSTPPAARLTCFDCHSAALMRTSYRLTEVCCPAAA